MLCKGTNKAKLPSALHNFKKVLITGLCDTLFLSWVRQWQSGFVHEVPFGYPSQVAWGISVTPKSDWWLQEYLEYYMHIFRGHFGLCLILTCITLCNVFEPNFSKWREKKEKRGAGFVGGSHHCLLSVLVMWSISCGLILPPHTMCSLNSY